MLRPKTKTAAMCNSKLKLSLPTVVDEMGDTVNMLYRAWPERIYVIRPGGEIAYKGGIGPFGFHPKKAETALVELTAKTPRGHGKDTRR